MGIHQGDLTSYLDLCYKLVNGHREDLAILRWNDNLGNVSISNARQRLSPR